MKNDDRASSIHRSAKVEDIHVRNDDRTFRLLCNALGDEISFAIIKSTMKGSRSAIEISKESRIPVSSVYKKIKKLQNLRIISVHEIAIDGRSGKKVALYRCEMKSLELSLSDGGDSNVRFVTYIPGGETQTNSKTGGSNLFSAAITPK